MTLFILIVLMMMMMIRWLWFYLFDSGLNCRMLGMVWCVCSCSGSLCRRTQAFYRRWFICFHNPKRSAKENGKKQTNKQSICLALFHLTLSNVAVHVQAPPGCACAMLAVYLDNACNIPVSVILKPLTSPVGMPNFLATWQSGNFYQCALWWRAF